MMLEKKINDDYISAMKAKDKVRSGTLNFLRAQIKNILIDKKIDQLEDVDVITVIKKQVKQRQDSIEQYEQGGRKDLAEKENTELIILKEYLPQELSQEMIQSIVDEAIKNSAAASMKDMGSVMKLVGEKVAGRADNKLVADLVKKALATL